MDETANLLRRFIMENDIDIEQALAELEANSHTEECGIWVYEVQECDCR